jgi:hypothetical protein
MFPLGPLAPSAGRYSGCRGPGLRHAAAIEIPVAHSVRNARHSSAVIRRTPIRLPAVADNDLTIGRSRCPRHSCRWRNLPVSRAGGRLTSTFPPFRG